MIDADVDYTPLIYAMFGWLAYLLANTAGAVASAVSSDNATRFLAFVPILIALGFGIAGRQTVAGKVLLWLFGLQVLLAILVAVIVLG